MGGGWGWTGERVCPLEAAITISLPPEDAQGVPETAGVGGDGESTILTRIMVVNATVLFEATGYKVRDFRAFVQSTEPKPHLIIVHEVNGFSGEKRVREELLHGALAIYGAVYTPRN